MNNKLMMNPNINKLFFEKREFLIPLTLFVVFLLFTLPGISWGAPDAWHPDEIVVRSIKALAGEWKFSQTNFDYPDLPQYVMYWLGKIILGLGKAKREIVISSRVLSAVLAGLSVVLAYIIARRIGGTIYVAGLSGILLICVTLMPHNARFAHNDTYITFFTVWTVLCLVNYKKTNIRSWLYASFIIVGMAASSKYNVIALIIVPILIYLASRRQTLFRLRTLETLFIGGVLTFTGFVIGTPTALTSMSFYFRHMLPALLHTSNYLRQPDSNRGVIGQYAVLVDGLGLFLFLLFAAGFLWTLFRVINLRADTEQEPQSSQLVIVVLSILAMDLPIMFSYNYQPRFFLPIMPLLAITAAFFVEFLYMYAKQRDVWFVRLLNIGLTLIILYSFARNISVMLLFINDARFLASAYINSLPADTTLEYT